MKSPSLTDLVEDWLKDSFFHDDGWCVSPYSFFEKWPLIYKDNRFSSVAVWLWDDKALNPSKHATLQIEDTAVYDYHAADPDFFQKIRQAMDEIEERWKPQ